MRIDRKGRIAWLTVLLGTLTGAATAAVDALPDDPRSFLAEAFERRYGCNTRQTLTLVLRQRGREFQRQRISVATKFVDDRLRAMGRFTEPPDLRGTAILMLEGESRDDDDQVFLFLPALERVRRVSAAHRGDSFMGTDLTYEDLQRPRVEDFEAFAARTELLEGEEMVVVSARPLRSTYYERMETWIARKDAAILRVVFFKRGSPQHFKVIETPRGALLVEGNRILPKRMVVTNLTARTETEVFVDELELDAVTEDSVFTTNALLSERNVPPPGSR